MGKQVSEAMRCPNCGKELLSSAVCCDRCGSDVGAPGRQPRPKAPAPQYSIPFGRFALTVLCIVAVAALLVSFLSRPEKVVELPAPVEEAAVQAVSAGARFAVSRTKIEGVDLGELRITAYDSFEEAVRRHAAYGEGMLAVAGSQGTVFLDRSGSQVFSVEYTLTEPFSEGLAVVRHSIFYGYLNSAGEIAISAEFDGALSFSEGLAAVRRADNWGYIDTSGREVISFRFQDASSFHAGTAVVKQNDRYGVIDRDQNVVVPFEYEQIFWVQDSLALAVRDDAWFLYRCDEHREIGPIACDGAFYFTGERARVQRDGRWGFINRNGDMVIGNEYEDARDFQDGLAAVRKNGLWGFIDENNNTVIPLTYTEVRGFSEGLAAAARDGRFGYIDRSGACAVEFQYDSALDFSGGYALVSLGGKLSSIDRGGAATGLDYQIDPQAQQVGGIVLVSRDNLYGYISTRGEAVVPVQYDFLDRIPFVNGFSVAQAGGATYVLWLWQ